MAVAFNSATTGSVTGSTTLTFSHTPAGSNRVLIVCATSTTNSAALSATFNGVSMTQIAQLNVSQNGAYRHAAFYLNVPDATTANVVVTSASSANIRACAATYTGVMQDSSVIDGSNSGQNDGVSNLNVAITTTYSGTWGVSCVGGYDSTTNPTSQTSRSDSTGITPESRISDTNTSLTPGSNTATIGGNGGFADNSNIYFGIREAGAAPTANPKFLMFM